jgi:hypothetical protein
MPAMTKAEWLAAFGRLMLEVQEFERGLVVLLVARRAFKNSEAAFAAVEAVTLAGSLIESSAIW